MSALVLSAILSVVISDADLSVTPRLRTGDILVANGTGANIISVDPDTGEQSVFAAGDKLRRPLDVVVLQDRRVLVVDEDFDDGALLAIDPVTRTQTVVSLQLNRQPCGVCIDRSGNLYVTEQLTHHRVVKIDPLTGNVLADFGGSNFNKPMLLDISGGDIVVPNRGNGTIVRVHLATGTQIVLSEQQIQDPHAALFLDSGDVLVSAGSHLYLIDDLTLDHRMVSKQFSSLTGLALDRHGAVLAADRVNRSISRVDLRRESVVTVSSSGLLQEPFGIAVVPKREKRRSSSEAASLTIE